MDRAEHLLVCLAEECNELAYHISKALRFGLRNYDPRETVRYTNAQQIAHEMGDLHAVYELCRREGILPYASLDIDEKFANIEKFMGIARKEGTLT